MCLLFRKRVCNERRSCGVHSFDAIQRPLYVPSFVPGFRRRREHTESSSSLLLFWAGGGAGMLSCVFFLYSGLGRRGFLHGTAVQLGHDVPSAVTSPVPFDYGHCLRRTRSTQKREGEREREREKKRETTGRVLRPPCFWNGNVKTFLSLNATFPCGR